MGVAVAFVLFPIEDFRLLFCPKSTRWSPIAACGARLFAILGTAVAIVLPLATPLWAQVPDIPGWELTWSDEFNGPNVNTTNWDVLTRQNSHNNEKQFYLPEQATIVDGKLRITATNEPIADKQYRSARLESDQAFGPGRFEARIKLPTTQGMWPAFWLFPNSPSVPWPTGGEIDILENRGSQPLLVSSAYHWQTNPGPCCGQHQYLFHEHTATENGEDVNFHEDFHTYAVEWDESLLRFYVDGDLHWALRDSADRPIFETPKNIILNLAVGGHFGGDPNATTIFPQHMDIDYVRVWQRMTGLQGDYNADGMVDAADYTVWRDTLGQSDFGLAADGSGNGTVDEADYQIWRENFAASAATAAGAVPEPSAAGLLVVGACALGRMLQRSAIAHRCSSTD
jgi:beta-glucanase (GH16 family)